MFSKPSNVKACSRKCQTCFCLHCQQILDTLLADKEGIYIYPSYAYIYAICFVKYMYIYIQNIKHTNTKKCLGCGGDIGTGKAFYLTGYLF